MSEMPDKDKEKDKRATITVDGTPYVLPALDTMDIDEAIVLYDYSSMTFDQIFELEGLHPGVIGGLLHVAIQRSDRALRPREVKEMVGKVNMMAVLEEFASVEVPDPTKAAAPSLEPDSSRSPLDPDSSSGDAGSDASGLSPVPSPLELTGSPDSPLSAQTSSAV
jgi:hypothetical protein